MGLHAKLAWIALFFCLGLIALAHCIPVEVIYTGEGCDCPSKLDFSVNVPSVPKPKRYRPIEYGYKIEVPKPREAKAKVSYSFDFTVEEPRPTKPVQPSKSNLFAMIDRVAIKKGDCKDSYAAPPAPSSTCRCGQCAVSEPLYRYVFNHIAPISPPLCNCQRPNCKCNLGRAAASSRYSPNSIFMGPTISDLMSESVPIETDNGERNDVYTNSGGGDGAEVETINIRRKRDLQRTFFRPRKLSNNRRQSRFVKLYRKNLAETPPQRLFDFEGLVNKQHHNNQHSIPRKTKRKTKKTPYAQQRSRLVKRDIKGEYDLLEKEREQMDLTLPEIIQFMPETLQPDFKRGQCYYGCGSQSPSQSETDENNPSSSQSASPTSNEYNMNSKESQRKKSSVFMTYIDNEPNTETGTDTDNTDNTQTENGTNTDSNTNHDPDISMYTDTGIDTDIDIDLDIDIDKDPMETNTEEHLLKESNTSFTNNAISSSFTKRNAASYHTGSSTSSSSADSAYPKYTSTKKYSSALKSNKKAYNAHLAAAPPISTNPNYKPQQKTQTKNAQSSTPLTTHASAKISTSHYGNGEMSSKWNLENNKHMHKLTFTTPIQPDSNDNDSILMRRYAGDLDAPFPIIRPHDFVSPLEDHKYSVKFIDGKQLDKIIANIVYSHPEFLYATAHLGGALVDPPSWQEQEAVDYAKHIVKDRLSLLFGKENDYSIQHHIPSVPIPLHGLLPPLY